jgi:hypothetical protein
MIHYPPDRSLVGMDRWLVHMVSMPAQTRSPDWPGLSEKHLNTSSPLRRGHPRPCQSRQKSPSTIPSLSACSLG